MIRAMPDIPAPPMPTKCTRPPASPGGTGPPEPPRGSAMRASATGDLQDGPGELLVGVAVAERGGGGRHAGYLVDVDQHRQQPVPDPLWSELIVGQQHPAAVLDDGQCVEPLLAVPDRQRDVRRGEPDSGELGAGVRAGPA